MAVSAQSRRLDADLLTPGEVERLLKACSAKAPTGIRNRAMIALAWRSGLRIGEVLALQSKDVDLAAGTIVVQHGKGDKRRVVGLDAGTAALVERWITARAVIATRRAPLFCTLDGEPVDASYVRHLLPRLARKAGIEKRAHAHDYGTRSPSNLSARERPCLRFVTCWGTAARRSQTGICEGSGRGRRSSSSERGSGVSPDAHERAGARGPCVGGPRLRRTRARVHDRPLSPSARRAQGEDQRLGSRAARSDTSIRAARSDDRDPPHRCHWGRVSRGSCRILARQPSTTSETVRSIADGDLRRLRARAAVEFVRLREWGGA